MYSSKNAPVEPSAKNHEVDGEATPALRQEASLGDASEQHVERGELGEAQPQSAELGREAHHELAPERAAHRNPLRDLTDVLDPRPGCQHGRGQVRLEPAGDRPARRRGGATGHRARLGHHPQDIRQRDFRAIAHTPLA
jgi:hypothetical protein